MLPETCSSILTHTILCITGADAPFRIIAAQKCSRKYNAQKASIRPNIIYPENIYLPVAFKLTGEMRSILLIVSYPIAVPHKGFW